MILSERQIFERYKDNILKIVAYDEKGEYLSHGSAVIIQNEKIVVTNYHNIIRADSFKLLTENDKIVEFSGIVALNPEKDILILKLDKKNINNLSQVKINHFKKYKIADKIVAIGFQENYGLVITNGIISGIDKTVKTDFEIDNPYRKNLLQITASISQGSSGGGIFDINGKLIGISTLTDTRGQNLNFAINIHDVYELINESKKEYYDNKYSYIINKYLYNIIVLSEKEDFVSALIFIDKCLELKVYEAYFISIKIKILYYSQNFEEALKISEQGACKFTENKEYFDWCQIIMHINLENYERALEITEIYTKDNLYEIDFFIVLGVIKIKLKKYKEAIDLFESKRNLENKSWDYFLNLAEAYKEDNKIFKSIRTLYEGILNFPNNSSLYMGLSNVYFYGSYSKVGKENYILKSLDFVNRAIYLMETQNEIYYNRVQYMSLLYNKAEILKMLENYNESYRLINIFINFYSEFSEEIYIGYEFRGDLYLIKHDYKSALKDYEKTLNFNKNVIGSIIRIALVYSELNDNNNLKVYLKKIIKKEKDIKENTEYCYCVAYLYYKLKNYPKANKYAKLVYKRNKFHKDNLYLLTVINNNLLGSFKKVKEYYDILFKYYPDDKTLYINWSYYLVKTKLFNEAIITLTKSIGMFENFFEAYQNRGEAKYSLGLFKEAIKDFNKVIELSPNCVEAYCFRGYSTFKLGLYRQSLTDWEHTIVLNTDYENELQAMIKDAKKRIKNDI